MKNRIILIVLLLVALIASAYFLYFKKAAPAEIKQEQQQAEVQQSEIPPLPITSMEGSEFTTRDLKGKLILIFFQTDCDHCQREAKQIQENLKSFKDYKLYFISSNTFPEIQKFSVEYKLAGVPNVYFNFSTAENVVRYFGAMSAPSIFIYSDNGRMVKSFKGEAPVDQVVQYL
jgi:thioredoxin-related protein